MGAIPTFKNETKEPAAKMPEKTYTETELAELNIVIEEEFNGLKTRRDLERFYTHDGAGTILHGIFHVNPNMIKKTEEKVAQWSGWRRRKYPFDRLMQYERMAEQSGEVARKKTIVPHGTGGAEFEYPDEEIDPGDIPF